MISRREYEEWFGKVTDEEWKAINEQICEIIDRMYEEDHPLDD